MNCGSNLGGIFVINLIIFCTFVLHFHPLSGNCEVSVCLCIVDFEFLLSNWPWNWMRRYCHYIQKKKCVFLLSSLIIILLLLLFIDVISYYIFCVFLCCLLNYFVFFLCPCPVSVIDLSAVVSSTIILKN